VSALAWITWVLTAWAVFFLFMLFDLPVLLDRPANWLRHQHLPHWPRRAHAVHHGRHSKTA
jgi:hypothetical protein